MLKITSLSFDYEDKQVLNDVSFTTPSGTILHLRGDNGAGKTTLLRLLAGLLQPTFGDIYWHDQSIYQNLSAFQANICYVGHKTGVSQQLTVKENCLLDLHWKNNTNQLNDILLQFKLDNLADNLCCQLSAGQRRRVALLRLFITSAPLWLLDEPLTALDSTSVFILSDCFKKHLLKGGLIILTSHQALPTTFEHYQVYNL